MEYTVKQVKVPSCNGSHRLHGVVYLPEQAPKGILHIVHGMTEHIARYEPTMAHFAALGYIVMGYDHLGHGFTVNDDSELGFIAHKDGWKQLVQDVKTFSDALRQEYGAQLPYYLLGHSMGSFIVRLAAETQVRPDKLIIMGTGGPNPAAGAGLAVIGAVKALKGERYYSALVDSLAFGSYNKRFGGGTAEDPSPWLTTDEDVRKRYYADKLCTFKFTVSAMGDLIRLTKNANRRGWYTHLNRSIPILLVAGEDDPVGNYGKGVEQVYRQLLKTGHSAQCILYKGARHEILNERCARQTQADIQTFLEA